MNSDAPSRKTDSGPLHLFKRNQIQLPNQRTNETKTASKPAAALNDEGKYTPIGNFVKERQTIFEKDPPETASAAETRSRAAE